MYSEKVMDHFEHPRNVGEIEGASGVGTVGNAKCGDIMRIYFDIDDNQIIQDVKFKTFGCGAAVATGTGQRKIRAGSTGSYKQGGNGSSRRSSAGQSALFSSGRGSNPCSPLGLCTEKRHQDRRP